jgi:hypothetical protein
VDGVVVADAGKLVGVLVLVPQPGHVLHVSDGRCASATPVPSSAHGQVAPREAEPHRRLAGVGWRLPRSSSGTPQSLKSSVLRVTTVSPWMWAGGGDQTVDGVAGAVALRRPHSSAMRASMGRIPVGEACMQLVEAAGKYFRLRGIPAAQQLNDLADLSERHNAQVQVDVLYLSDPRANVRIAAGNMPRSFKDALCGGPASRQKERA